MDTVTKKAFSGILALALSVLVLPGAADAQEQAEEAQEACSAQVTPQSVDAGQEAVSVTVELSRVIGSVEELNAYDSGIGLADPAAIPKTEMAREEGEEQTEPRPIEIAADNQRSVTLWLNTEAAEPGSYSVQLKGTEGHCKARLEVAEPGS